MPAVNRLRRNTTLPCQIAQTFANRPRLFEVAASLLVEQWPAYGFDATLDPVGLQLASFGPVPGIAYVRPLYQLLAERYCLRTTLNLTPGQDVVCRELGIEPEQPVPVDLVRLEALINDCGPLLVDRFNAALVDFWCAADRSGETPWSWLSNHLQERLRSAVAEAAAKHELPAAQATLKALAEEPANYDDQLKLCAEHGITLQTVVTNFSADWQLDPNLASAVLIERPDAPGRPSFTLLFTPAGRLLSFPSRTRLLEAINAHWPAILAKSPPAVKLSTPERQLFQAQAANLLQQLLEGIEIAATAFHAQGSAQQLANALDRLSSLAHLCSMDDLAGHGSLIDQLPGWMRDGDPKALIVYSSMLTDVARSNSDADGKTWLSGVPSAQAFACERLGELIRRDHPTSTLDPAAVRVINHQTTATAIPVAGQLVSEGTTVAVTFSLTQLAIANLGLLKPGRVTLETTDGQPIPTWLDTSALRALIDEADIGATYPKRLKALLLDDAQQSNERRRLLADQLRSQLPTQLMTRYIQHGHPSLLAIIAVEQLFAALPDEHDHWVIRPLGLLRTMDAFPDHPRNAWLIENDTLPSQSCLLYRPLHHEPIVEFRDRLALLVALGESGELQDDIIHRLPEEDRRVYKHGGFMEPHIFFPLEDDWAVAPSKPAPVTLSREAPVVDVARAIYEACVEEALHNFKERSASSDEARWQRWEELGWLLLNTVLPFVEGPVAEAAWLVQMETAFAHLVQANEDNQPGDRSADWIALLVNVAFLIFNHAMERMEQEHPLDATLPPGQQQALTPAPVVVTSPTETRLDFSWAQPTLKLDSKQASALDKLRVDISVDTLGSAVPSGPMRGLYLHADQLYSRVEGKVYKVQIDTVSEQFRIVGAADGNALGPWLRRDEAGRWQLDLGLRLKGGMPPRKQIARSKDAIRKSTEELAKRLVSDSKSIVERIPELRKVSTLGQGSDEPRVIRGCLEKLQVFETFIAEHIQRLHELNARTPVQEYKVKRAGTLFHQLECQLQIRELQLRLYKPERTQLTGMIDRLVELSPADIVILRKRLEDTGTLIDQLFDNATAFNLCLEQMRRLAGPAQPKVAEMLSKIEPHKGSWTILHWRFIRCENRFDRLILDEEHNEGIWLLRAWRNIDLAISQYVQLHKQANASDEVMRRVLQSIASNLDNARARLSALADAFGKDHVPTLLNDLRRDVNAISTSVDFERSEYPGNDERSTISQLNEQLPGLIETRDDGLLLGQPRTDDNDIVDIPGVENDSVSAAYKREDDQWVAVDAAATNKTKTTPGKAPAKLKTLLKQSTRLLDGARKEVALMQSKKANTYIPVDIQDSLLGHRARLDEHRAAIELRLTRDNQTDEGTPGADAAMNIKAIEDMSSTLADQATAQRARVALLQAPRMGELQFLLEREQVVIESTGPRHRLAKVAGRSDDYLEEFVIRHQNQAHWFAHFHYPAMNTRQADYTAGHLKTAEQRYERGRLVKNPDGREIEVYRSPIDRAAANAYFFTG